MFKYFIVERVRIWQCRQSRIYFCNWLPHLDSKKIQRSSLVENKITDLNKELCMYVHTFKSPEILAPKILQNMSHIVQHKICTMYTRKYVIVFFTCLNTSNSREKYTAWKIRKS